MIKAFDYGTYGSKDYGTEVWVYAVCPGKTKDSFVFCDEYGDPVSLTEKEVLIRGNLTSNPNTFPADPMKKLREKKEADTKRYEEQLLYYPEADLMDDQYVVLVSESEDVSMEDGKFIVGAAYPVFHGCLLDEDDACIFDRIHDVKELNEWDKGIRVWKLYDSTSPSKVAGLL